MTDETRPDLFIIESLKFEDEYQGLLEGRTLRDILSFSGKRPEYIYIRIEKELIAALDQFHETQRRYLHISCHGDPDHISLTLDSIPFARFENLVKHHLHHRRLFMSACEVVNDALARAVLIGTDCYSLIGPQNQVGFGDAALMWATFYHLAFRDGDDELLGGKIRWALRRVKNAYGNEFEYFKPHEDGFIKVDTGQK